MAKISLPYAPDDYVFVHLEYPYDPEVGQRPTDEDVMEAQHVEELLEGFQKYEAPERRPTVFHRLATDSEVYHLNESLHCPEGY